MGVRLDADDAWEVLGQAHTGILTTLRRDGTPISLPMWFAAVNRTICFGTPPQTKKVIRLRNDPRASFLVESGEQWAELQAVQLNGSVELVEGETEQAEIRDALDVKYEAFRAPQANLPDATKRHYAERVYYRLVPHSRFLSWDNSRLFNDG